MLPTCNRTVLGRALQRMSQKEKVSRRNEIAKVVSFFQKGGKLQPENYRLIGLLSSISKNFESVVCQRMTNTFSQSDVFPENQYGFQKKSILHQRYN